jgi:prophage maintenance system killer protein
VGGWGSFDDDGPEDERARLEAEGGRRQARLVSALILQGVRRRASLLFQWTPTLINTLHYHGTRTFLSTAGVPRTRSDLEIAFSKHALPPHEQVPRLMAEACAFVNKRPNDDPLFLAAYILWRICWIHPYEDGNGRTARAVSYVLLNHRLGFELGGEHPIPQRIKQAPRAYHRALEAADEAWRRGDLDVSQLMRLLTFYLEAQLRDEPMGLPPWA